MWGPPLLWVTSSAGVVELQQLRVGAAQPAEPEAEAGTGAVTGAAPRAGGGGVNENQ